MNVVDNLNSVQVINKPCMSSRRMSLLPRATLHSDSKQYVMQKTDFYIFWNDAHCTIYGSMCEYSQLKEYWQISEAKRRTCRRHRRTPKIDPGKVCPIAREKKAAPLPSNMSSCITHSVTLNEDDRAPFLFRFVHILRHSRSISRSGERRWTRLTRNRKCMFIFPYMRDFVGESTIAKKQTERISEKKFIRQILHKIVLLVLLQFNISYENFTTRTMEL